VLQEERQLGPQEVQQLLLQVERQLLLQVAEKGEKVEKGEKGEKVVTVIEAIITSLLWTLITQLDYNNNEVHLTIIALNR
jgi:hypothetical protein